MDKKIIFQKFNFNNIYLLYIVTVILENIFLDDKYQPNIPEQEKSETINYDILYELLYNYKINISNIFAIIPHFIIILFNKSKKNNEMEITKFSSENNSVNLIYNNTYVVESYKKRNYTLLLLLMLSIFDFLIYSSNFFYLLIFQSSIDDFYEFNCMTPLEIIFQFISSYFILKINFYKLQYFSLLLNVIIFIIILIIDIINITCYNSFDGKIYIFYPFLLLLYSLEFAYGKKLLLY